MKIRKALVRRGPRCHQFCVLERESLRIAIVGYLTPTPQMEEQDTFDMKLMGISASRRWWWDRLKRGHLALCSHGAYVLLPIRTGLLE